MTLEFNDQRTKNAIFLMLLPHVLTESIKKDPFSFALKMIHHSFKIKDEFPKKIQEQGDIIESTNNTKIFSDFDPEIISLLKKKRISFEIWKYP